jgi:hypothetical protein
MDWLQTQKLIPDSPGSQDYFGGSVAISGKTALIGAYGKNGPTWPEGGGNDGIVYVFLKSWGGWNEIQKLTPQDAVPGDWFGSAVAIDNDYAIIGAPGVDGVAGHMTGAAYIFERENGIWIEKQKLLPLAGGTDPQFGFSVSISDKYAIVGCPGQGYVYIYERHFHIGGYIWVAAAGWTLFGNAADQFGYSVSISAALPPLRVIVGAKNTDYFDEGGEGKVYIYEKADSGQPWPSSNTHELYPSDKDIAGEARFGHSVVIEGNYAVVGAPEARNAGDTGGQQTGHVYIFKRAEASGDVSWEEVKNFNKGTVNRDLSGVELYGYAALGSRDKFGGSVDIKDNIVVAGCQEDYVYEPGAYGGSIYILEQIRTDIWKAKRRLQAADASDNNNLGRSVSIGEHGIIGGAWRAENGDLNRAGAAYIFEYTSVPKTLKQPEKITTLAFANINKKIGPTSALDSSRSMMRSQLKRVGGLRSPWHIVTSKKGYSNSCGTGASYIQLKKWRAMLEKGGSSSARTTSNL